MKGKTRHLLIAAAVIVAIGAMTVSLVRIRTKTDSDRVKLPSINDVPVECWAKLAGKRIFFGHQSVGYNIIDGITDIINERDYIKLYVVETRSPVDFDQPILAHSQVGKNTDPVSKIESFRKIMDSGVGDKVDMVFFKFCYVDINRGSDPQKIFDSYKAAIEDLKSRYPRTKFLHFTVPLCSTPKGIKRNLKQNVKLLLGRPGILEDNIKRERYNALLRNAYFQTDPFFDLALVESVGPGSLRCYVTKGTEKVFMMASEYTDDGGHLNSLGRKKAAEQLLIILAELANN